MAIRSPRLVHRDPSITQMFALLGDYIDNLPIGSVVLAPGTAAAVAQALLIGSIYGKVYIAPIGGGADDKTRLEAVQAACAGLYEVEQLPGTWYSGTTAYTVAVPERMNVRPTTTKIMFCGDDQTVGTDPNMSDSQLTWRGVCWDMLRNSRGNIELLGLQASGVYENRAAVPGANPPGNARLGDWHVAAVSGNTIAQISSNAAAAEAVQGTADVYVLLGGENDIIAGRTAAEILVSIAAFVRARLEANPLATVLVCTMCPHSLALAARDTVSNAVNAGLSATLSALGDTSVRVVPAGSLLSKAHIDATGYRPNPAGYSIIGEAVANAVLDNIGLTSGSPHPRRLTQRVPVARRTAANIATACSIVETGTALCPRGTESFSMGVLFYPNDISGVDQRVILWTGPDVVPTGVADGSGVWLRQEVAYGGGTQSSLSLYIGGILRSVPNLSLSLFRWHCIGVSFDNAKHEAIIYCMTQGADGRPCRSVVSHVTGIPAFTMPAPARVGMGALLGAPSAVGLTGDMWIARNHIVTVDEMENWFDDGAIPSLATAYYPMNEGAGTNIAPSVAFGAGLPTGTCTNTWSAASAVAEPWHRGFDS